MLLTALKLKVAALAAVAGIETNDLANLSPEMDKIMKNLEAEQGKVQKDPKNPAAGGDWNKAFSAAVEEVKKLADKGDTNACYALAHWGVLSGGENLNVNAVVDLYRKAANEGNNPAAKIELAQVLLQAFKQDADKAKEAIKLIIDAEAAGNKLARRTKAQLHLSGAAAGAGIPASIEEAVKLLQKGSDEGDGDATLGLYQVYSRGATGYPQDYAKALDLLKLAAEKQNNATALGELGSRLLNGDQGDGKEKGPKLVTKNVTEALKMFENAATGGLAAASRILGQIYENGLGADLAADTEKAFTHYTKAGNGNDAAALLRLAQAFETGILKNKDAKRDEKTGSFDAKDILVQPNPKGALDLYRMAAQNGAAEGYFAVGKFYETGAVVDKDPTKAFALYSKAANAGYAQAMSSLAGLYANGAGVAQDVIAAAGWYKRSADAPFNYAPSQIAYGMMSEQGAGIERNGAVAASYYEMAAEQGAPLALIRLSTLNLNGIDGKPNLPLALAYATMANDVTKGESKEVENFVKALETAKDKDGKEVITADVKKQAIVELGKLKTRFAPKTAPSAAAPAAAETPAATPAKSGATKKKSVP